MALDSDQLGIHRICIESCPRQGLALLWQEAEILYDDLQTAKNSGVSELGQQFFRALIRKRLSDIKHEYTEDCTDGPWEIEDPLAGEIRSICGAIDGVDILNGDELISLDRVKVEHGS